VKVADYYIYVSSFYIIIGGLVKMCGCLSAFFEILTANVQWFLFCLGFSKAFSVDSEKFNDFDFAEVLVV
jgi:hypothetical protein